MQQKQLYSVYTKWKISDNKGFKAFCKAFFFILKFDAELYEKKFWLSLCLFRLLQQSVEDVIQWFMVYQGIHKVKRR